MTLFISIFHPRKLSDITGLTSLCLVCVIIPGSEEHRHTALPVSLLCPEDRCCWSVSLLVVVVVGLVVLSGWRKPGRLAQTEESIERSSSCLRGSRETTLALIHHTSHLTSPHWNWHRPCEVTSHHYMWSQLTSKHNYITPAHCCDGELYFLRHF